MNIKFKNEFKNLNADVIAVIINRCAGQDILQTNDINSCFIKYIEDEKYGFWDIEWGWEKFKNSFIPMGGHFKYRIKITPFRIDFENTHSIFNPITTNKKQQIEDYLYIYINKTCPNYKQAILEETDRFIKMIEIPNDNQNASQDEICK